MPKAASKKPNAPAVKKTKLNLQIREILADGYSFVLGEKFTASISSVTLEDLMRQQIDQIEGTDGKTDIRPNKIEEVDRLVNSITKVVDQVKKLPVNAFSVDTEDRSNGNVNTSVDGDEEIPS